MWKYVRKFKKFIDMKHFFIDALGININRILEEQNYYFERYRLKVLFQIDMSLKLSIFFKGHKKKIRFFSMFITFIV